MGWGVVQERGASIIDMSMEVSCSSMARETEAEKRTYKIRKEVGGEQERAATKEERSAKLILDLNESGCTKSM